MTDALDTFGDYYLIKKIATGGMAEIFLARTHAAGGPQKYVALKMIHPRYMEDANFHRMIVEEAKIAVQLSHENIGQVFDLGKHQGRYFIVMEFIDGYDLSRLQDICANKALQAPMDAVAFIGRKVCEGLNYVHNANATDGQPLNLIHRDISPQNLLVSFCGDVKIIDFGIAKASTRMQQTHAGVIKGKFYYMSPEQAGADKVDQRSDLFSLGICLWETACGRSLFRREGGPTNPLAILHEIRTCPIPRVREFRPDCPRELDDIIAKALSRNMQQRFQDAAEMGEALTTYLASSAYGFNSEMLASFVVDAFEKEETSKEVDNPNAVPKALMTRAEFLPSEHSVIFSVENEQIVKSASSPGTQTLEAPDSSTAPEVRKADPMQVPQSGIITNMDGDLDVSTKEAIGTTQLAEELALSDTVFIQKDEVEAMKRVGEAPVAVDHNSKTNEKLPVVESDPNSRTHMLDSNAIHAAHVNYNRQAKQRTDRVIANRKQHTRAGYSTHPLFRWLVLAVLLLSILSATLWLVMDRQARQHEELLREREHQLKERRAPPIKTTNNSDSKLTQAKHWK